MVDYPAPMAEGRDRNRVVRRVAAILISAVALAGCGGGEDPESMTRGEGIELAARLPSDDALNIAIADVAGIRESIGMKPGTIPPSGNDDHDLVFLDEIKPALGIVVSGAFPQPIVDEAMRRATWVAGVAGDKGVTAIAIEGDPADFEALLTEAGLTEDDGEWVAGDDDYAIAIGEGLIVFADDPGDAKPVIENDDSDPPEELDQLDGDGQLITLSRFGADCVDAIATTDTPGENGEVAFFTTATPDPGKITGDGVNGDRTRTEGDSARVSIPAAEDPIDEPPALRVLQVFGIDYDCDA